MDTSLHAFPGLRHGKEVAPSAVESFPHGDGYEVLPAKGNLPALYLSVTASEASRPGYSDWKRHILMVVAHEPQFSWGYLLALAYVAVLRVQRVLFVWRVAPGLSDRICIALQRIVTWAYRSSFRSKFSR
jgi:hypothetical protein